MITVLPKEMLRKMAPKKLIERLVTKDLTINRAALSMLAELNFISNKTLETIALRVIRTYKKNYSEELGDGLSKADALEEALNSKKLLVNRVQNAVVFEISKEIKSEYRGEFYEWLPSDADEPDPLHQLKYGKKFQIGKGEMPGDRFGCRCGMYILVSDKTLDI